MFKNRIGAGFGALLSNIVTARRGAPVVEAEAAVPAKKPARKVSRFSPSVAGRVPRTGTPKLKRPRTPADFAAVQRAQDKRERKARKLRWDDAVHRGTYYFTRDAAVIEEARRVHDLFSTERAA